MLSTFVNKQKKKKQFIGGITEIMASVRFASISWKLKEEHSFGPPILFCPHVILT